MSEGKNKTAVIGSGFGGLAAAIRLQSAGIPTTLFEKRALPGGRAYVYRQDGFTFDAGPTVITAPDCVADLFKLSGRKLEDYCELLPITPLYRLYWESGFQFDYTNDLPETLRQIGKKSKGDAKSYEAFLEYTRQVFEAGYTELAHVPFLNFWSMMKVAPELMRLQAFRSVYSMVSKYIKDPELRQAFSFHSLLVGGNPFNASSIYTLIHFLERKWGVYFPKGGTGALVSALVTLFEELGGEIHYNAEIDEICTENNQVTGLRDKKGHFSPFDRVVSNADVAHTYLHLLKQTPSLEKKRAQMERKHYSMSLFLLYFGTNRKYPNLAHHNVLFGGRYKELLSDIFDKGVLPDDFSLYLHAPSRTDSSLAPEGCESFYVLSPVAHLGKMDLDWALEGPRYAQKILNYLDERYMPGLKQSIITQKIFTPVDFKNELNAHLGSAFSLEPRLTQSAYFRTHNRDAHIQGLYFVGAGTHPGAGVPGVINSARATVDLILADAKEAISVAADPATVNSVTSKPEGEEAVLAHCREMIQVGSKSFSFAAKLFDPKVRDAAFFLYGWCRYCDDEIDNYGDDKKGGDKEGSDKELRLSQLRELTEAAFKGADDLPEVFRAMAIIGERFQIPSFYPLELLEGMRMDVQQSCYDSLDDLYLYCYRVAGVVGLMMTHVMGLAKEEALKNAADLGTAMQLTNIARDISDDFKMGRVYLPLSWLRELEILPHELNEPKHRDAVAFLVRRLLRVADIFYDSGNQGLKYLSLRSACAVGLASCIYRAIGKKVQRRGSHAWDTRTVVSMPEKVFCALKGLVMVAKTIPYRLVHPWKRIVIQTLWRQPWIPQEIS